MATTEELAKSEEANQEAIKKRKEWLKKKNWFIIVPGEEFVGETSKIVYALKDFAEELDDNLERKYFKGEVEIVYRTNKWKEELPELS